MGGHCPLTMKALTSFVALTLTAVFAHADIVIIQKMESAFMNGNMTMKIKGDKARMEMPAGPAGQMTVIMDTKTGEMTTLMHAQKMAMKMNIADAKKQAEAAQKQTGIDPAKVEQPKATGQKEKVGTWDTEVYDVNTGAGSMKMWVAKDFPNYKVIMAQMNKLSAAMGGSGFDPSKFDLPGMVVKSEMASAVGKVTTLLVKAGEENVADSEFALPSGYTEMKVPSLK